MKTLAVKRWRVLLYNTAISGELRDTLNLVVADSTSAVQKCQEDKREVPAARTISKTMDN